MLAHMGHTQLRLFTDHPKKYRLNIPPQREQTQMDRYDPFEQREEGDWALFFCKAAAPQLFTARLFPTLDRAQSSYGGNCKTIYDGPADLAKKFGGADLVEAIKVFRERLSCRTSIKGAGEGPHCDEPDEEMKYRRGDAAIQLWKLLQQVADRVSGINHLNENDDEEMFVIRLDRMTTENGQVIIAGFNKQKRQVAEQLIKLGKSKAYEHELKEMMGVAVRSGEIKTKQDPWRIFSYYAPELGDEGFVYYPSKRHKQEDFAQNS